MIITLEKHDSIMIQAKNGYVKMFVDDEENLQVYDKDVKKIN